MKFLIKGILCINFVINSAYAEYRAYQYMIEQKDQQVKILTSSLNPQAYRAYKGHPQQKLTLMRTWICPGQTGGLKQTCPSPYHGAENGRN